MLVLPRVQPPKFGLVQLNLFGRRANCYRFQPNQPRLLLAAVACTRMINLRRQALKGIELA